MDALCELLVAKGVGARRLDLLFHRVDSALQAIRIGTAKPNRDPKRLTRLLCDKLETIDPGFGVEAMSLCATLAEPFETKQMRTSLLDETPDTDVSGLVDILANRVGGAKLYRFAPVESDVPERSVRRIAPAAGATKQGWPSCFAAAGAVVAQAGADRDDGAAAGPSAGQFLLAGRAPPGDGVPTGRSGFSANGGSAMLSAIPCAIIFRLRTSRASASGFFGQAMASIRKPARNPGSCTGFSDDRACQTASRAMPSCR